MISFCSFCKKFASILLENPGLDVHFAWCLPQSRHGGCMPQPQPAVQCTATVLGTRALSLAQTHGHASAALGRSQPAACRLPALQPELSANKSRACGSRLVTWIMTIFEDRSRSVWAFRGAASLWHAACGMPMSHLITALTREYHACIWHPNEA